MPAVPGAQAPASYSPQQLQQLWVQNGGNPKAAPMAAAIAMAESTGRAGAVNYNTNGTVDRGPWQINSIHGALSTFDPIGNVKAAIQISGNGSNWSPWTTFNSGAYKQYLQPATAGVQQTPAVGKTASLPGIPQGSSSSPVGQAKQQFLDNFLKSALGGALPAGAINGLYSHAQQNLLTAHGDLQTLAGPTTTLNVHPATGEGGTRLSSMVKAADSLVGKPYIWGGGHASFNSPGYDCSGFVSAVLHAGGFLNSPQTTQTLPQQPSLASGPGKFVTVYDRTDGGTPNNDHTIIDLNGAWYESGGQAGPWGGGGGVQRIHEPSQAYLQSFNRTLHPLGL